MSGKFKYIIIEKEGQEIPIIFSKFLQHRQVANGYKVVSAGFVEISRDPERSFNCYGESVSLRVVSRGKQDVTILKEDYEFKV